MPRCFVVDSGEFLTFVLVFVVVIVGRVDEKVEAGVVTVLSELSTSYKEKNQLYCARALCNLACHHGSEKSLVEGGGVYALMMIALVRTGGRRFLLYRSYVDIMIAVLTSSSQDRCLYLHLTLLCLRVVDGERQKKEMLRRIEATF